MHLEHMNRIFHMGEPEEEAALVEKIVVEVGTLEVQRAAVVVCETPEWPQKSMM